MRVKRTTAMAMIKIIKNPAYVWKNLPQLYCNGYPLEMQQREIIPGNGPDEFSVDGHVDN
jgi:hypothetical protein